MTDEPAPTARRLLHDLRCLLNRRRAGLGALLVALMLLAVIPVTAMVVAASLAEQRRVMERAEQDMAALADLVAAGQEQLLDGTAQMLTAIGSVPAVLSGDVAQCSAYLQRLKARNPLYASMGVIAPSGRLLCGAQPGLGEVDLSDRLYFRRAMETGRLAVGEYIVGRTSGVQSINVGLPVRGDDGVIRGVAFAALDLRRLQTKLRAVDIPPGMQVRITDAGGTVLAGAGAASVAVGLPLERREEHHLVKAVAVSEAPALFVTVSASYEALLAPAVHGLRLELAVLFGLLVVTALAIWLLSERLIARPLAGVLEGVRGALADDRQVAAPPRRSRVREIALLQLGLRRMGKAMRRRRGQRDDALREANAAKQGMVEILDRMSEGFIVTDPQWRITYLNQRATDMLHKGNELLGQDFWTMFPDDPEEPMRRGCERALATGRPWDFERYFSAFGRWFEMRLFTSPDGIGVFVEDTTERRQTLEALREREARYRELFEFNPNVMWVHDSETLRFLSVNEAAVARYGFTPEEFMDMSIAAVWPDEDVPELLEYLASTQSAPQPVDEWRIWRHRGRDGAIFLVEMVARPITFDDRPARLVLVNDATERLVTDSRLRRNQARLERQVANVTRELDLAGKVLESFSFLVSHDLRSPLQVIDGFAREIEARQAPSMDAQGRHYLARIRASTRHMGQLIDAMLKLSRVTRHPLQARQVDLAEMARERLRSLRAAEPERAVMVEIEQKMPAFGDETLLRIVVDNLLDNAWKFTGRRDDAWIQVGQKVSDDADEIVYFIYDNGAGFDTAYADKLFVAFQRLHSTAEFPGLGVGLAIVHRIVTRHGGRIWAESEEGHGSRFFFTLGRAP